MHAASHCAAALFAHSHVASDVTQRYFHATPYRGATLFSCMLRHAVAQRYFQTASQCDAMSFSHFFYGASDMTERYSHVASHGDATLFPHMLRHVVTQR